MVTTRDRLLSLSAAVLMLAAPLSQDGRTLRLQNRTRRRAECGWIGPDLSRAAVRRPRAQRGQTNVAPLGFRLGGLTYAHALPRVSDGNLALDPAGAATRVAVTVGADEGAAPFAPRDDNADWAGVAVVSEPGRQSAISSAAAVGRHTVHRNRASPPRHAAEGWPPFQETGTVCLDSLSRR